MVQRIDVDLPPLHPSQNRVRQHEARFKVLACGRRWGKTRLGAVLGMATALQGGRAWWIAPTYKVAAVGWRLVHELGVQMPGNRISRVDRSVTLPTGGSVQVRSADDPDSLRGEGLDRAILDECAYIKAEAWTHAIRPALSDREGDAVFISSPAGRNWFWHLAMRGIDVEDTEWMAWTFPTSDNPFINPVEIAAAKKSLPERVFRQEYLAEFLEDGGGVFRGVEQLATADEQTERIDDHQYIFGIDWGRTHDYTVITVIDTNLRHVVAMDRFTDVDYTTQIGRLKALHKRFLPIQIIAEENSMGGPLVEQLRNAGLPVKPFMTTNASKEEAIRALEGSIERQELRFINDPILIGELQAYEQERLPSGRFRFKAPEGMHDDCVMSLAIAWHTIANRWLAW